TVGARGIRERGLERFSRVGVGRQEFAHDDIWIEPDLLGVGSNERPAKNSGGPSRKVVALERFEQRQLDFGPVGDRDESNCLFFTPPAQSSAETFKHAANKSPNEGSNMRAALQALER